MYLTDADRQTNNDDNVRKKLGVAGTNTISEQHSYENMHLNMYTTAMPHRLTYQNDQLFAETNSEKYQTKHPGTSFQIVD